ncbi:hypothetical protein VP01_107g7 [Puccinia sorghi]|uniref:Uncharacterized protein n=1 Tax=Puccinia sorghi TaxID=27349 RepID=A0A0L6VTE6_9BASI|nr:hypothetical protein VP01_107g7 [Puccinia sorghi]
MTASEKSTAILVTLSGVVQRLNSLTQNVPTPEFIRQAARLTMLRSDLEAYSQDHPEKCLFWLVMHIKRQPKQYLRTNFPPNFHQDNLTAKRVVHAEVKHQLKQVRYKAQNFLLTGICYPGSCGGTSCPPQEKAIRK